MPRGGYREGAGRKREYDEPIKKILLGLPESVLEQLDRYAKRQKLSRPKAVAALLKHEEAQDRNSMLSELKSLKKELTRN